MEARTPDGKVGVIIGRFQVPDLHDGHRDLIDTVVRKHKKILIFICSTPGVLVTRKNPLDFHTRKMMVQEIYPDAIILPLHDMPSDNDWSATVDGKIQETFGDHATAVLYGSRDAFIPHYFGNYPTVELAESFDVSGTEIREACSDDVRQHSEFRRGVVYAAHNKYPATFPTVDIAVIDDVHHEMRISKRIALGRKKIDLPGKWRFPGGFVDPKRDGNLEGAAKRELAEEFGRSLNVDEVQYVGSHHVQDWRYRNEVDQIVTTLFVTKYLWGPLTVGDDLDEAKWFDLDGFDMNVLVDSHQPLMQMVLVHLEKE